MELDIDIYKKIEYDYCIIGAGPTGLTVSYLLSKIGKKCILIDKNKDIGGCHRVNRVNGLFTEHGPRIYSSSFINTKNLLKEMNIDFNKLFTKYNFTISNIGNKSIKHLTYREISYFVFHFILLLIDVNYGVDISMKDFMDSRNFTNETKDYIDRLCRLTDGASSDRYSLNKFFQLVNQQSFHDIYQPKKPNDVGLFKLWKNKLYENNIDLLLNTEVISLNGKNKQNVESITIKIYENKHFIIKSKRYVFCIPPYHFEKILTKNTLQKEILYKDAFGDFDSVKNWIKNTKYMNYIPIIFHWNYTHKNISLPNIWGFPNTEWGIAFIVLSNYMNFNDNRSFIVISTCITKNIKSTFINKTPDECNEIELKQETLRQLRISFPKLPEPTYSILSPTVKYINNKWIEDDTAFISSSNSKYLKYNSDIVNNIFQVGTQNGKSEYKFTSIESAISNAIDFSNYIEKDTNKIIKTKYSIDLIFVIKFLLFCLFCLFCFKFLKNKKK
jgi:hypothetical protein